MSSYNNYITSPATDNDLQLASTMERVGASLIDALIFMVPAFVIGGVNGLSAAMGTGGTTEEFDSGTNTALMLVNLALVVAYLLYEVIGTSVWGRTLGKAALGLRVVKDTTTRTLPTAKSSFIRYAVKFSLPLTVLGMVVAVVAGLAIVAQLIWLVVLVITIANHARKQGLHDRAASTFVVKG